MKTIKNLLLFALIATFVSCQQTKTDKAVKLTTFQDSVNYSYGVIIAQNFKMQVPDADPNVVAAALKEALTDKEQFDPMLAQGLLQKKQLKASEGNKIKGEEFLAENKNKEGVITTESGLQYQIIREGTGEYPTATSKVKVHYTGSFVDGKEFNNSYKGGQPIEFQLDGVIKAWTEGVQLCKVGGKIKLFCPYQLAYGERGRQGTIPPYSVLVFEIELLEIVK